MIDIKNMFAKLFGYDKIIAGKDMQIKTLIDLGADMAGELGEFKRQATPMQDINENIENNKHPSSYIVYMSQETDGTYERDVREWINPYDDAVPTVDGIGDDAKALNACLWIQRNVEYTDDKKQYGYDEYWAKSYQTLKRKKGDCEDGAILMYNIMLKSGVPYWKIRISAGDTTYGGHAYVTYFDEANKKWVAMDWCYFPNQSIISQRPDYKDDKLYGNVWFSFNEKFAFSNAGTKLQFTKPEGNKINVNAIVKRK